MRAVSLQEISIVAGIPLPRTEAISKSLDWEGITVAEAERFIRGCNFDPLDPADRNRQAAYNRSCQHRRTKFTFLKKSPLWATEFLPLIQLLKSRRAS